MFQNLKAKKAIKQNLHRYDGSLQQMSNHINTVSQLTNNQSGFFGIPFPLLKKVIQKQLTNKR